MSKKDIQSFIQNLLESEFLKERQPDEVRTPRPVVTLCRDHGAGGHAIGEQLARRLGVQLCDKNLIELVAQAAEVEPHLMAALDEKMQPRRDAWMYNLLTGKNAFFSAYRYHLVNVVLALAETGAIILGRGAHLILASRPAYRVRVVGSEHACARRVAAREGLPLEAAARQVQQVNRERARYLEEMFHHKIEEGSRFDLVINTDRFGDSWEGAANLVITGMKEAGWRAPRRAEVA